ncbi:sulfurtransferase TusA family protein [Candidatus Heimdallarchaeota archaeon]|jgi:TusA-related sulfurtransferase|nr:MAG: sulfurtransferase TusA family protein [Candidatus Heimdallarchaeota archaeon]
MTKEKVALKLDFTKESCPERLLEIQQNLNSIPLGGLMEIVSDSKTDEKLFSKWCERTEQEFFLSVKDETKFHFFIRRTH